MRVDSFDYAVGRAGYGLRTTGRLSAAGAAILLTGGGATPILLYESDQISTELTRIATGDESIKSIGATIIHEVGSDTTAGWVLEGAYDNANLINAGRRFPSAVRSVFGRKAVKVAQKKQVLVDSNAVGNLRRDPTLGGRIGPDETPVISYVTGPELRNAAAQSDKFFLPKNIDELPVLQTRPSLDTRINIRGQSNRTKGKFGSVPIIVET